MTHARVIHKNRYPQPGGRPEIDTKVNPLTEELNYQAIAQLGRSLADVLEDTTFAPPPEMWPALWDFWYQTKTVLALSTYINTLHRITGDLPVIEERYGDPRPSGAYTINAGTHVYVAFDDNGQALYVGVTDDLFARMASHRRGSEWWPSMVRLTWEEWPDRKSALRKELILIRRYRPTFNKVGNPDAKENR